jgi:hypothetical protein
VAPARCGRVLGAAASGSPSRTCFVHVVCARASGDCMGSCREPEGTAAGAEEACALRGCWYPPEICAGGACGGKVTGCLNASAASNALGRPREPQPCCISRAGARPADTTAVSAAEGGLWVMSSWSALTPACTAAEFCLGHQCCMAIQAQSSAVPEPSSSPTSITPLL